MDWEATDLCGRSWRGLRSNDQLNSIPVWQRLTLLVVYCFGVHTKATKTQKRFASYVWRGNSNPNVATPDLAAQYGHVGLDDLAREEFRRAIGINPTSQTLKAIPFILAYLRADPDGWFAEFQNVPTPLWMKLKILPGITCKKGDSMKLKR